MNCAKLTRTSCLHFRDGYGSGFARRDAALAAAAVVSVADDNGVAFLFIDFGGANLYAFAADLALLTFYDNDIHNLVSL
jgi:hypothetical protein